jgi:hypothetical protein
VNVRPATGSDRAVMASTPAPAFATDPPLSWFVPDAERREALLVRHFRASLPLYGPEAGEWAR